jgi:hypothetical protein
MAVTYTNEVKQARITATRDHFVSGSLEILTSGDALLATFALTNPGGTVAGAGVWTLAFSASTVTASGAGTAAKAQLKTSGGAARLTGLTVGTSGSDINLNNTSIADGQSVTISSATITHAA